jgi:hypothetical protein
MELDITVNLSMTKPDIVGTDWDAIKAWIKANIIDKLPANVSCTYNFSGHT